MICIITDHELARSHGTGAQIIQLFQGSEFHHFYWQIAHGQRSDVQQSTLLADCVPNVPITRAFVNIFRKLSGATWWYRNRVNGMKLRRLVESGGFAFDVAFVVVSRESGAARALSIIRSLKLPYVVNMMDVLHEQGLDPASMPAMDKLLKGASGLIALLPSIAEEMAKFTKASIQIVPIGKPLTKHGAMPPEKDTPIRIIISGRPYPGGCRILAEAWKDIEHHCRNVELNYVGPHYSDIPSQLKPVCRDLGYFTNDDDYQRVLSMAHLAFLSGPDKHNMHGKWSFPSRTVDHLMAGQPMLACVPPNSATGDVLRPIFPKSVAFTQKNADIVQAINRFTADKETWISASRAARSFAEETMSLDVVREKVFRALQSAKSKKLTNSRGLTGGSVSVLS